MVLFARALRAAREVAEKVKVARVYVGAGDGTGSAFASVVVRGWGVGLRI